LLPAAASNQTGAPAAEHPLVVDIRKRFAADVIRREPLDRASWLAKLHREAEGPGDVNPD